MSALPIRFTAVRDFWADETQSQYVAGLSYSVWPEDGVLLECIERWANEGKIFFGGGAAVLMGRE